MTADECKQIYEGKKFFRIDAMGNLTGPFNNIFYMATYPLPNEAGYLFIQARPNKPPLFLRPDEVYVKEG